MPSMVKYVTNKAVKCANEEHFVTTEYRNLNTRIMYMTFMLVGLVSYLIFVIFFTRLKFLENKIYTKKRPFFALNM